MKINLSIDLAPSRTLTRWALLLGVPVAVFAGGTLIARADVNNLVSFTAGEKVSASKINGNFNEVKTSVLALEQSAASLQTDVAALKTGVFSQANGKKYSVAAIYKGATAITYTGNLKAAVVGAANGYAASKTLCEASLSSASAHMCTSEEVVRSMALGIDVSAGGVSGAFFSTATASSTASYEVRDCMGWTSASAATSAMTWKGTSPQDGSCEFARPILCCD